MPGAVYYSKEVPLLLVGNECQSLRWGQPYNLEAMKPETWKDKSRRPALHLEKFGTDEAQSGPRLVLMVVAYPATGS